MRITWLAPPSGDGTPGHCSQVKCPVSSAGCSLSRPQEQVSVSPPGSAKGIKTRENGELRKQSRECVCARVCLFSHLHTSSRLFDHGLQTTEHALRRSGRLDLRVAVIRPVQTDDHGFVSRQLQKHDACQKELRHGRSPERQCCAGPTLATA